MWEQPRPMMNMVRGIGLRDPFLPSDPGPDRFAILPSDPERWENSGSATAWH